MNEPNVSAETILPVWLELFCVFRQWPNISYITCWPDIIQIYSEISRISHVVICFCHFGSWMIIVRLLQILIFNCQWLCRAPSQYKDVFVLYSNFQYNYMTAVIPSHLCNVASYSDNMVILYRDGPGEAIFTIIFPQNGVWGDRNCIRSGSGTVQDIYTAGYQHQIAKDVLSFWSSGTCFTNMV